MDGACANKIFNPEHDQCLANGNCNYDPPQSSLRLSRDCAAIMDWLPPEGNRPAVWGWDSVVRNRLAASGLSNLPDEGELQAIRELSHRRVAIEAKRFIIDSICSTANAASILPYICDSQPAELAELADVREYCRKHASIVLKAPWSGSGKGLRWIRTEQFSRNDEHWCRKLIAKQGSVIAERRRRVVRDFAMLYYIGAEGVVSEGMSLFLTDNGAYRGNVLASDNQIMRELTHYVPELVILAVESALRSFIESRFVGRYVGPLGVDMYICDGGESDAAPGAILPERQFQLVPCSEFNVRNTMGRLARRYFDLAVSSPEHSGRREDEALLLLMLHSDTNSGLRGLVKGAECILTEMTDESLYAVAMFAGDNSCKTQITPELHSSGDT